MIALVILCGLALAVSAGIGLVLARPSTGRHHAHPVACEACDGFGNVRASRLAGWVPCGVCDGAGQVTV